VLAQWRGIDLAPQEKSMANRAQAAAGLVPKVLSGLRIDHRRQEAELIKIWNHLLDPVITAHAQPTGLRRGTLFVSVDTSVWLDEIVRYRRREILERLQHSFGAQYITRISFRIG
jgi:predicted nucleic acid-binding Zn ribbon protein